jgi:hypothetical protein
VIAAIAVVFPRIDKFFQKIRTNLVDTTLLAAIPLAL